MHRFYLDFNAIQKSVMCAVFLYHGNQPPWLITLNIFSKLECETPKYTSLKNVANLTYYSFLNKQENVANLTYNLHLQSLGKKL